MFAMCSECNLQRLFVNDPNQQRGEWQASISSSTRLLTLQHRIRLDRRVRNVNDAQAEETEGASGERGKQAAAQGEGQKAGVLYVSLALSLALALGGSGVSWVVWSYFARV